MYKEETIVLSLWPGAAAEQGGTSDPGKEPQLPETLRGEVRRRGAGPADL